MAPSERSNVFAFRIYNFSPVCINIGRVAQIITDKTRLVKEDENVKK